MWIEYDPIWQEIQNNRNKLVTNKLKPFIGYCKDQRDKYSKKGDKLNELKKLKKLLQEISPKTLLSEIYQPNDVLDFEHIKLTTSWNSSSKKDEPMLAVVDSKYPLNRQLSEVLNSIDGKIEAFGKRAERAAENSEIDLKATYHSFRVCWELEEILLTGELTFPSRYKELMKKMRNGDYDKDFLDFWLVSEIERIEKIPNNLPDPDYEFWDDWILEKYLK